MKLFNCLTWALSQWRYSNTVYLSMRKSKHSWFPHFKVAYEYGDVLTVREYVPVAPQEGKLLPPLWFKGRVKTTTYHKKGEAYE